MHPKFGAANKKKLAAKRGQAAAAPSEDNHVIVEELQNLNLEDGNQEAAARKRPAEGELDPTFPDNTVFLQEESHHLDCFDLLHVETQAPLIRTSDKLRMTTSAKPSSSSMKRVRRHASSSSAVELSMSRLSSEPEQQASQAFAVENVLHDVYDETTAIEDQESGSSNNQIVHPKEDLSPSVVLVAGTANSIYYKKPLKALLDSGSTSDFIYADKLPKACKPRSLEQALNVSLLNSTATVNQAVDLEDVVLTELSLSKHIKSLTCYVAQGASNYDIIIGRRTMKKLGIKLDFETSTIHWKGQSSPMKPLLSPQRQSRFQQVQQQFLASLEDKADSIGPQGLEFETNFFTSLKLNESEYQKHEVDEVAAKQTHLTAAQQQELKPLLRKFTKLFSGKLGSYPHRKMHLDVDRQALKRLRYQRPYPIPHVNYDVFYQELQRLVELGVLE